MDRRNCAGGRSFMLVNASPVGRATVNQDGTSPHPPTRDMTFLARDAARPEKPSQWVASLPHGNGSGPKHDAVCKGRLLVQADATSVWLIHRFSGGAQLGLRVCFDPRGLAEIEVKSAEADA